MVSKWAVSMAPLERVTDSAGPKVTTCGESAESTMEHDLWRDWEQLSGGGPIPTTQGLIASPDRAQIPDIIIRLLHQVGTDKVNNSCQSGEDTTAKAKGHPPDLASMDSLWGPLARPNRAKVKSEEEDRIRESIPTELRYPHNPKRWGLGVGRVQGE